MPPRASGQVIERRWRASRTYALRFPAYGERHYVTLGSAAEGWTRRRAEEQLENVLADVRRGIWIPPERGGRPQRDALEAGEAPTREPSFHRFASDWLGGRRGEVAAATYDYYAWALSYHLLPYFAHWRLSEIDIAAVDAYRRFKVAQAEERRAVRRLRYDGERPPRPLSPASINKTIDVLAAVLALAVEYGHIASNPAAGRRRRLRAPARRPVHLDSAEQIEVLLEACALRWGEVDLAGGRITVTRSKTQAGLREIPLLPLLRDELAAHKADAERSGAEALVFPSATGRARDKDNLRSRVLQPVARRADERLRMRGRSPLPVGLTPHKLRHTFASVLVACGEDPAAVMAALGHTDPKFTLRVYAHVMRREPGERERLKALVDGGPALEAPGSATKRARSGTRA